MRQFLPAVAVVSAVVFAGSAFAANHQGQRYRSVVRAQERTNTHQVQQPYALTGAERSQVTIERRDSQPRPAR